MTYSHIGILERQLFSSVPRYKVPVAFVARSARRHRSTVYRELARNTAEPGPAGRYNSWAAHHVARDRRSSAASARRSRKLAPGTPLTDYVLAKLRDRWSPEQISARLPIDFPDDRSMRVSHQAVYDLVARDKREGDGSTFGGGTLFKLLRRGGRRYRRKRTSAGRTHIPGRVGIEHRRRRRRRRVSSRATWRATRSTAARATPA